MYGPYGYYSPPSPPLHGHWHATHRYSGHLSPPPNHSGLHRSHSQGHVPNIYIRNEVPVDTHARAESRGPPVQAPMPPQMAQPMMAAPQPMFVPVYPPEHHDRNHRRLSEELLLREIAELKLQSRSRSRGRTTGDRPDHSADWYQWQLKQKEKEAAEAEQKRRHDEEVARIQKDYELKTLEEENRRRIAAAVSAAEHQRLIEEHEQQKREDAKKAKDAEEAFRIKMDKQAQEARDREKKAYDEFVRRQKEQEEEEERRHREYLRKQKEKEEEDERIYQDFLRKQKEKQEAEEKKKKEEEDKINATMKERLEKLGYSAAAIDAMIHPGEKKKKKERRHSHSPGGGGGGAIVVVPSAPQPPSSMLVHAGGHGHVPVYPRINRAYLDVETLDHYKVPWEFDRANKEYIVILREMDKFETDVLFEHTARRRKNMKLLVEDKKKEPKYAWVRRRSRSKSRGRDVRVVELRRT